MPYFTLQRSSPTVIKKIIPTYQLTSDGLTYCEHGLVLQGSKFKLSLHLCGNEINLFQLALITHYIYKKHLADREQWRVQFNKQKTDWLAGNSNVNCSPSRTSSIIHKCIFLTKEKIVSGSSVVKNDV